MAKEFIQVGVPARSIDVLETGKRYNYGAFLVEPVELFHDVPNMGLKIYMGGEKAIYIVDSGYVDSISAPDYDYYFLEANHREAEIKARISEKQSRGEFAYEFRAAKFHLSRGQAEAWLARNAGENSKIVWLHGHKEDRNGPD